MQPPNTAIYVISIPMSNRRPMNIVDDEWPLIANADRHDDKVECQANQVWSIRVREHADGRRVVYGWLRSGTGSRGREGGFLVEPQAGRPDDGGTIRAIRRIGGIVEDDKLADECIADMPAEDLDQLLVRVEQDANADPNEPMFVVLGRDRQAPAIIRWPGRGPAKDAPAAAQAIANGKVKP